MDSPICFIAFIGGFILSILTGITSRFLTDKNSQKFSNLKTETKEKLVRNATAQIRILKCYFWMLPWNLVIIPVLIYIYAPKENVSHIIIILSLSYVGALQMFWNKKHFIKLLEQGGKETK